jgi:hypothetical protein
MLATPSKITSVKPQGPVFGISAPNSYGMDALCTKLSVGRLTTKLKFAFLSIVSTLGSRRRSLVSWGTGYTLKQKSVEKWDATVANSPMVNLKEEANDSVCTVVAKDSFSDGKCRWMESLYQNHHDYNQMIMISIHYIKADSSRLSNFSA